MNPNYRLLWEQAIDIGIKVGHGLREKLNLDEDNFRFRAPYSHKNSRNVYIYRAIDEAQKAAMCLMRWKEFFLDDEKGSYNKDVEKQMMRITRQAVFDEQSLRCRKLRESLVDTILFLNTNEDIYFKDYFYFYELFEYQSAQKDRKEFYNFVNRNSEYCIEDLKKCILKLEHSGIDINKRWYLREKKSITSLKEVALSSFRAKYKQISVEQGPEIITLLAKSYSQAYGESRDIHFSPDDTSYRFNKDSATLAGTKVALLLIHLILKLQELSLIDSEKFNDILPRIRDHIEDCRPYTELTTPQVSVGDYVLVWEDLGQVIEERQSKYGYHCYHVRYIDKPPIGSIKDDWFASFEIFRLGNKEVLLKKVISIISRHSDQKIDDNAIASINDMQFEQHLSHTVRDVLKLIRRQSNNSVDRTP
jgi:hypothetical protein